MMDNIVEIESLHEEMEHRRRYGLPREGPELREAIEMKSEVLIARDFLDRLGAEKGHVGKYGDELLVYSQSKGVWEGMSIDKINEHIQKYQGYPYLDSKGKQQPLVMSSRLTDGVVRCVFRDSTLVPDAFFDEAPVGVQFANGFLRMQDGKAELLCSSPRHGARWSLPYDYDPEARCPRWYEFLAEIFMGDADFEEKAKALQEFLGACVVGTATIYQRCLLFKGEGANGKSVLLDAIKRALFGNKRTTSIPPQIWEHDYHSARLLRSAINVVSEMPQRDILASERFKSVVGGDEIPARFPYGHGFDFRPRAGHVFAANTLPACNDDSHGYWRRFVLIEFNRDFTKSPERKRFDHIVEELVGEAPGIMAWVIRGAERLEAAGEYTVPTSHHKLVKEWQLQTNQVAAFVEDCCERETQELMPVKDIYSDFRDYVGIVGRKPLALNKFGQRLLRLGIPRKHTKYGNQYQIQIRQRAEWTA